MSTIGCAQNDFQALGTFSADRAPILHEDLHNLKTDRNKLPLDIRYLGVPFRCAQSDFHARDTFGANRAPILRRN